MARPMPRARAVALAGLLAACATAVRAERLPVRAFSVADGLPHGTVLAIESDSRGFLWFCTAAGLSRFDGRAFVTVDTSHGLPSPLVTDLVESRTGDYWIATGGGVCRLAPDARWPLEEGGRLVTVYPVGDTGETNLVHTLYEDRAGRIWAGTNDGLFVLDVPEGADAFRHVELAPAARPGRWMHVEAIAEDDRGVLWVGTSWGLILRAPDGRTTHFSVDPSPNGTDPVRPIFVDRDETVWLGHMSAGLVAVAPGARPEVVPHAGAPRPLLETAGLRRYTAADGLGTDNVWAICRGSDGRLWAGTVGGGLTEVGRDGLRTFAKSHGLPALGVRAIAEDRVGNLWLGLDDGGAVRLARAGFATFSSEDGLGGDRAGAVFETRTGDLLVVSGLFNAFVSRFDGERFVSAAPGGLDRITHKGWGWDQVTLQDRGGEWWHPTGEGLLRYAAVDGPEALARARPKAVYTARDGLPSGNIFRVYEDARGDVWVGTIYPPEHGVARWERATGAFRAYGPADGLPEHSAASAFVEDAHGNLWMGFYTGGLARYAGGRFTRFGAAEGGPEGRVYDLFVDGRGRLWIATNAGAFVAEGLGEARPRFTTLTTADGLASDATTCVAEDGLGRIYVGTSRGLCRIDFDTGRVDRFTTADGLASDAVNVAYRDRRGALWFGTDLGLSRLVPVREEAPPPPEVWIGEMLVAGRAHRLAMLGQRELLDLDLAGDENNFQIGFFGLDFAPGHPLRYQYRIEGAGGGWSEPTEERTVVIGNLPPGSYRFEVRALDNLGRASELPAAVSFRIAPPVWRRWWFLALCAAAAAGLVHVAYRYRLRQALELERVRTRIATDLHDDIGASLTQIALLSEVTSRRTGETDAATKQDLSKIASVSRDLVDSMSDIVWAINPERDNLDDLVTRMRRFASDTLAARDIHLRFRAAAGDADARLGADTRREVFLIFKEAVNNATRHSGCTEAVVEVEKSAGWLEVQVRDDGRGIDASGNGGGHGLKSMRQRAERLGGTLEIASNDSGTTITLRCPIGPRHARRFPHV
jgi:ligand-binding sensor domain-containing protein/two-component sensor histidine kinase